MNFGEDRVRVWDGLMAGLRKYHEILKGNFCIFLNQFLFAAF